jgi:hypothetical protein
MANTAQGLEGTDFRDIDVVFPSYSATGLWLPEIKTYDLAGNTEVLSHTDLLALGYDLSVSLNSSVSNEVTANETVTTDELGTGHKLDAVLRPVSPGTANLLRLKGDADNDAGETRLITLDFSYVVKAEEAAGFNVPTPVIEPNA